MWKTRENDKKTWKNITRKGKKNSKKPVKTHRKEYNQKKQKNVSQNPWNIHF